VPLAATASFALASIRLDPKRATYGAEAALFALTVLVPTVVFIGGNVFICDYLFRHLPNAACIPVNLFVLGVAIALTTVRRSHCGRSGAEVVPVAYAVCGLSRHTGGRGQ
jgi:hypothetical protein